MTDKSGETFSLVVLALALIFCALLFTGQINVENTPDNPVCTDTDPTYC